MEPPADPMGDVMTTILEGWRRADDPALAPYVERIEQDAATMATMATMLEEWSAAAEPVRAERARRDAALAAALEKLGVSPISGRTEASRAVPTRFRGTRSTL